MSRIGDYIIDGEESGRLAYCEVDHVYKIERKELPESIRNRRKLGPLPLDEIDPGETLLIECDDEKDQAKKIEAVRRRVQRLQRKLEDESGEQRTFSVLREGHNIRVYRLD